jgi:glycerophosphoryl diester phosphodiesterase
LKKTLVIAHRGFSGKAPENTMAAFMLAAGFGVDFIETDIHQTKDGVIVCIHDEKINRTTDKKGRIKDLTYSELLNADAGVWFNSKFKGERVPRLEEVFELNIPLLIEVKKGSDYYPAIEQNLLDLLSKYDKEKKCIIQSFDSAVLQTFSELTSQYELHKLVTGDIPLLPLHIDTSLKKGRIMQYLNHHSAINPNYKFVTGELVEKIHEKGKKIFTWTVNEKEDMVKLSEAGVDGIITDFPDILKKLLG